MALKSRVWALTGLVMVAVIWTGIVLRSGAAPIRSDELFQKEKEEPKKEPKKDPPKPPDFPFPDIEKMLPPNLTPEQKKMYREHMEKMMKMMKMMQDKKAAFPGGFPGFPPGGFPGMPPGFGFPFAPPNRLGAGISPPSDDLIAQLDLPKDQGIVVRDVKKDSAAGKAGIKSLDLLLEIDGKNVPSKMPEFVKMLNEFKVDQVVDAVVLRKGKKENIKGLKLPEAPKGGFGFPKGFPGLPPGGFPELDPKKPDVKPLPKPKPKLPDGFQSSLPSWNGRCDMAVIDRMDCRISAVAARL